MVILFNGAIRPSAYILRFVRMNYNTFYSMTSPGRKSKNYDHQEQPSFLNEVLKNNQELVRENSSLRDEISNQKNKIFELETKNQELSIGDARKLLETIKKFQEKEKSFEQKFIDFRSNAEREHKKQYDDINKSIEKQHSQKYIAEIQRLQKKVKELSDQNTSYMRQKLQWDKNYISQVQLNQAKSQIESLTREKAALSEKLLQAERGFRSEKEQKHENFKKNIEDRMAKFQEKVQEKQKERQSQERQNQSKLKGVSSQLKTLLKAMLKLKKLQKTMNSAKFKEGLEYLSRTVSESSKDELPSFDGKRAQQQFEAMVEQINYHLESEKQKGIQIKDRSEKQLSDKNKKVQELEKQVRDKNTAIDRSNELLKQKNQQIQQKSASLKSLESSLAHKQREYSSLTAQNDKQKGEAKKTIGQLKRLITEWQQKYKKLLAQLNDSEMQAENHQKKMKAQISELKKEIKNLVQEIKMKDQEIEKLKKIKKDLERIIAERDATIKLLKQEIQRLKQQNRKLLKELQETRSLLEKKQSQNLKLKAELQDTRSSLEKKQSQNLDLTTDLKKKTKELTSARTDLNQAYEELRDLRITEQAFRQVNGKLLPELSFYMGKEKIQFDHDEPDSSLTSTLSWFKSRFNQAKFFGDSEVIPRDKVDFLLKEIKTFTNNNVLESKLLYKYDTRNTLNFHNFVDHKENMLIVIRLINNITVGGFSCYPLSKLDKEQAKKQGVGRGFLFNLTFDKSFQMRKDAKNLVMTYDEFFFLFGNSELRLRSQEKKFFSNFGVANSTFDNAGFPRSEFLGVHDPACNQLEIVGYEFYQVKFKQ